ncbi:MAG: hypothetical protein M3Z87_08205 [Lactobacillus sp.]|nr:hypothetical protein [Lactobacillus sp.]
MNGKKITFNGDLDNFKTKDKGVTIQIKTTTDNLSLDKLNAIADGQITVYLESSQLELIEELDGEFEVKDIAMLDKLHRIDANGQRETKYTVTTKDGSVYGLTEELYENLKQQMPEEPVDNYVSIDNDAEPKDDNDNNDGIDLFGINPETKKVEQVSE